MALQFIKDDNQFWQNWEKVRCLYLTKAPSRCSVIWFCISSGSTGVCGWSAHSACTRNKHIKLWLTKLDSIWDYNNNNNACVFKCMCSHKYKSMGKSFIIWVTINSTIKSEVVQERQTGRKTTENNVKVQLEVIYIMSSFFSFKIKTFGLLPNQLPWEMT